MPLTLRPDFARSAIALPPVSAVKLLSSVRVGVTEAAGTSGWAGVAGATGGAAGAGTAACGLHEPGALTVLDGSTGQAGRPSGTAELPVSAVIG